MVAAIIVRHHHHHRHQTVIIAIIGEWPRQNKNNTLVCGDVLVRAIKVGLGEAVGSCSPRRGLLRPPLKRTDRRDGRAKYVGRGE